MATQNWWPGKKVLISPAWINDVKWTDSKVFVSLSRETIKTVPAFVESMPVTREYESRLHLHYGRSPYWVREGEHESSFSMSGVK
ncbi:MAG: hypothetical protein ABSD75_30220 [Terriglobales bacterium]